MKIFLTGLILILFCQCSKKHSNYIESHTELINSVLEDDGQFYDLNKRNDYSEQSLPIGVFDSGIGGISVFDIIINADNFNAKDERFSDKVPDFGNESFIYFADQANMPYSNYVETGNKELLEEFILKDLLFLLNNRYNSLENNTIFDHKPSVKTIVIACNTATAYGKELIEDFIKYSNIDLKVIGVIDAGVNGVLETIQENENATIAVFATPATVESQAYVKTINELITQKGLKGNIQIVQQGGKGLHESIDNKPDFINSAYTKPYKTYQGPSFTNLDYKIEKDLLHIYNFETDNNSLLFNNDNIYLADSFQINSVENYVRYHIVSIVEKIRILPDKQPLKSIILACTHYPFVKSEINNVLKELKQNKLYQEILKEEVILVDPAENTAIELYNYLRVAELLNKNNLDSIKSYFYISVPNFFNPKIEVNESGTFIYDYQYLKRERNENVLSTLIVPFSEKVISREQLKLIEIKYPKTYSLINNQGYK